MSDTFLVIFQKKRILLIDDYFNKRSRSSRNSACFRNPAGRGTSSRASSGARVEWNVIVEIYAARKQATCQNAKRASASWKIGRDRRKEQIKLHRESRLEAAYATRARDSPGEKWFSRIDRGASHPGVQVRCTGHALGRAPYAVEQSAYRGNAIRNRLRRVHPRCR